MGVGKSLKTMALMALPFVTSLCIWLKFRCFSLAPRWGLARNTARWVGVDPLPLTISKTTGPISKPRTGSDSPTSDLSDEHEKFDINVTDDVTGQVKPPIIYP